MTHLSTDPSMSTPFSTGYLPLSEQKVGKKGTGAIHIMSKRMEQTWPAPTSTLKVDATNMILALTELNLLCPKRNVGELSIYVKNNQLFLTREIDAYGSKTTSIPCKGTFSGKVFSWWFLIFDLARNMQAGEVTISINPRMKDIMFNQYQLRANIDFENSDPQLELPLNEEDELLSYIRTLDAINSDSTPTIVSALSDRFERDQKLVELLKKYRGSACQICGFSFKKANGEVYSEAHHLEFLSKDGLDISKNMLVLCANHHRQFHYGNVRIIEHSTDSINVEIDGIPYKCKL